MKVIVKASLILDEPDSFTSNRCDAGEPHLDKETGYYYEIIDPMWGNERFVYEWEIDSGNRSAGYECFGYFSSEEVATKELIHSVKGRIKDLEKLIENNKELIKRIKSYQKIRGRNESANNIGK